MTDSRTHQLLMLLRAIDNMHSERAIFMSDWKSRLEVLEGDLRKLREDIISGQSDLFVKGATDEESGKANSAGSAG